MSYFVPDTTAEVSISACGGVARHRALRETQRATVVNTAAKVIASGTGDVTVRNCQPGNVHGLPAIDCEDAIVATGVAPDLKHVCARARDRHVGAEIVQYTGEINRADSARASRIATRNTEGDRVCVGERVRRVDRFAQAAMRRDTGAKVQI